MKYWEDATLGRIFNKVGDEFDISPSEVKELFDCMFLYTKEAVGHVDMPKIRIPYLGVFMPSRRNLGKLCRAYENPDYDGKMSPEVVADYRKAFIRVTEEYLKKKRKKKVVVNNKKEKE